MKSRAVNLTDEQKAYRDNIIPTRKKLMQNENIPETQTVSSTI